MLSPFKNLPADSRVWIYQSDRPFTPAEENKIEKILIPFIENWTAHDKALAAGFEIRYHHFIIIAIDEKMALASGCSIDKSLHVIRQTENELNLSLLNRNLFAYKTGDEVRVVMRKDFEEKIASGSINGDSIVFDNLVSNKKDYTDKWEVRFNDSWHKQLFPLVNQA